MIFYSFLAYKDLKRNLIYLYKLDCVSVSLSQNGAGLGAMWGKEKATEMLKDVGFANVEVKKLPHDFQNYYYIAYKNK